MKKTLILIFILCLILTGCATMTYTGTDANGKPFKITASRTILIKQSVVTTSPAPPLNYQSDTSQYADPIIAAAIQAAVAGAVQGMAK